MKLEIRHLRVVCAIAAAGSLSRAAGRLGVSQPALTAQLHRIEERLGGRLFVRGRGGVAPTELGARVLRRARPVISEVDALLGDLVPTDDTDLLRFGSVHLGCVGSVVAALRGRLPVRDIRVLVEPSATVLSEALAHRSIDAALIGDMDGYPVTLTGELAQRTLVPRLPIFVALAADHRLAGAAEVRLTDLADESWIVPPGGDDGSLASLRAACRRCDFEADIRYDVPSGAAGTLISSGQAVRLVEPTCPEGDGVVVRALAGEPCSGRLLLAWRRDRLTEAATAAVRRAALEGFARHTADNAACARWWSTHPELHPVG